jgi:RHS repeat-associated protein
MVVAPLSNRSLPVSAGVPADAIDDAFDAQGCARTLTPLGQPLAWDHAARLRRVADDKGTETYLYDSTGKRLRKRRVDTSGVVEETRYFDGFETLTRPGMPPRHRLALPSVLGEVIVTHEPGGAADDLIRFSLRDHATTSLVRIDDAGAVVSYEEYHPFGNVAFECASADEASLQTQRYATMPRDDTGLYDYGLRHYAPWHWRWISPDPGGDIDGLNAYRMARNNPIGLVDRHGLVPTRVAFDDKDIEGFEHIRQAMREGLKEDGLLAQAALYVIVGRSPQMLGEYMRQMGETVVPLPLSGLTAGADQTTVFDPPNEQARRRRDDYLWRSLQSSLVSISGKTHGGMKIPIVVVDYGVSGASIAKVHGLVSQHARTWKDPRADAWAKSFKGMGSTYQQPVGARYDVRMAAISHQPQWKPGTDLIHQVALNPRNVLRFRQQDPSDMYSPLLNPLDLSLRGTHRFVKVAYNQVDKGLAFTTSVKLADIDRGGVTQPPYLEDAHGQVKSMIEAARGRNSTVKGVRRKGTGYEIVAMGGLRSRWTPHLWFDAPWLRSLNRWYYGTPGVHRYVAAKNAQVQPYRGWRR